MTWITWTVFAVLAVGIVASSLGYYGVAVAKKNTAVTMKTLKDKRTCHTGFEKTSGWVLPIGWLIQKVPGFRNAFIIILLILGVPSKYYNLCALCPQKSCKMDGNDYAGYTGAFNCMKDGKGDVAFVKHLTTREVVGNDTSGYKYLCTDGKTQEVTPTSHKKCNLGQGVSHTVVARPENNADYIKILVQASKDCQPSKAAAKCGDFELFESKKYNGSNLLFKDTATELRDVGEKNTYTKWLGKDYMKDRAELKTESKHCEGSNLVAFPSLILAMFPLIKSLFLIET